MSKKDSAGNLWPAMVLDTEIRGFITRRCFGHRTVVYQSICKVYFYEDSEKFKADETLAEYVREPGSIEWTRSKP